MIKTVVTPELINKVREVAEGKTFKEIMKALPELPKTTLFNIMTKNDIDWVRKSNKSRKSKARQHEKKEGFFSYRDFMTDTGEIKMV